MLSDSSPYTCQAGLFESDLLGRLRRLGVLFEELEHCGGGRAR